MDSSQHVKQTNGKSESNNVIGENDGIDCDVIDNRSKDIKPSDKNIEIWEDLVNIEDLVKAMIICILTTFGAYILAPNDSYKPLLFGLVGAITGFISSCILIKPKREFIEENKEH